MCVCARAHVKSIIHRRTSVHSDMETTTCGVTSFFTTDTSDFTDMQSKEMWEFHASSLLNYACVRASARAWVSVCVYIFVCQVRIRVTHSRKITLSS